MGRMARAAAIADPSEPVRELIDLLVMQRSGP